MSNLHEESTCDGFPKTPNSHFWTQFQPHLMLTSYSMESGAKLLNLIPNLWQILINCNRTLSADFNAR